MLLKGILHMLHKQRPHFTASCVILWILMVTFLKAKLLTIKRGEFFAMKHKECSKIEDILTVLVEP